MRTLNSDVIKHVGKDVTISGWLHKKRLLGGLTFINVRDRSGLTQVVIQDKKEVEKLRGMQIGTVITLAILKRSNLPLPSFPLVMAIHMAILTPSQLLNMRSTATVQ